MFIRFHIILILNFIKINLCDDNFLLNGGCNEVNKCKCQYENGDNYNIENMINKMPNQYIQSINKNADLTYFFHPCNDITTLPEYKNETNNCHNGYSLCVYSKANNTFYLLATSNEMNLKVTSNNDPYILYKNKDNVIALITMACTKLNESYFLVEESEQNQKLINNFILFSPYACLQTNNITPSSFSFGTILLIIFFLTTFSYFSIGIVVNYFLIGTRGLEIIPNLDFWRDLPNLVRDGIKFIENGCKVRPSDITQGQDTYDAI